MQWADPASLLLIASMISSTKEGSDVFFACCYRDDGDDQGGVSPFTSWLASIDTYLSKMNLHNISKEGVNELVSEALHLSPRLTRPLSSTLHQKTAGNPVSNSLFFVTAFHLSILLEF